MGAVGRRGHYESINWAHGNPAVKCLPQSHPNVNTHSGLTVPLTITRWRHQHSKRPCSSNARPIISQLFLLEDFPRFLGGLRDPPPNLLSFEIPEPKDKLTWDCLT